MDTFNDTSTEMNAFISKAKSRRQKMSIVTLTAGDAEALLAKFYLKIGWGCRIERTLVVPRCFKCHGLGHDANKCIGPYRSRLSNNCGSEDRAGTCSASPPCLLCVVSVRKSKESEYVSGSSRLGYRLALDKLKPSRKG